jgi:hypothetical protein
MSIEDQIEAAAASSAASASSAAAAAASAGIASAAAQAMGVLPVAPWKRTPLDFGAVGNGLNDDRPAFAAMNTAGGSVYLPKPPVAWNVSSAIAMDNVSVEIDPTLNWSQATDNGLINWGPSATAFYPDTDGASITREHNRLFVHQGADFTGNFSGPQQGFVSGPTDGADWGPRDAALFVAQDRGMLSVVGFSSNENPERDNAIANCAIAGFAIGNKATGVGGSSARTFYGDLQFEQGQYGFGIELALKNKTGVTIDCTPYTRNFKVTGFWIVPGGDVSYGGSPTADVCVAMAFGGSTGTGMKFNKGIVFWTNALRPDANGRGQALALGQSQEVAWYTASGGGRFNITSEGQTTTTTEIRSDNEGVHIRGFSTETTLLGIGTGRTSDGTAQLVLRSDDTNFPCLSAISYAGTNGIRELRSRGTGALQIVAEDAAPVVLATGNQTRVVVGAEGRVGIGGIANPGAALDVQSTTGGVLLPRMTTTQRDAIASPQNGLVIYNTTANQVQARVAGAWVAL